MDYDYVQKSRERNMKTSHSLTRALLGVWVCSLFALVPASGTDECPSFEEPPKRPAWAQPTFAQNHKATYNFEKYKEESPVEWEFLGYTSKELHDRYDAMSPCGPEPARFWFHGCGGIDGGGFIDVRYGEDGKVEEAWYCFTGCTYTSCGKHFTDKTEALKHAIARATKNLQEHITEKSAIPYGLRRQLKTRARAYTALGKVDLAALDLKRMKLLEPVAARYDNVGKAFSGGSINVPLVKLTKEFERNGFQTKKLSSRKYKFFKPKGPSMIVTANSRQIVKGEEAVWLLQEEIEKEAVKIISSASSPALNEN
jgi:hypothetical protein